ncbi:MAG: TatD family hydrolase [Patescibacteria group bacterium]|nr:TatD family hydrolase [Patescibacteria group bacterium]
MLIDTHAHLTFKDFEKDRAEVIKRTFEGGVEKIWPLKKKLTEDDVYWPTKLACLEMIKTDTPLLMTCIEMKR